MKLVYMFKKTFSLFLIAVSIFILISIIRDVTITDEELVKSVLTNENDVQDIYQMLKDISEVFDIAGIKYSIDFGTTLGALRHQGMIPWDDDADLIIFKEEEHRLQKLKDIFHKLGYSLVYIDKMFYKISKIGNKTWGGDRCPPDQDCLISWPFVDIFIMSFNKEKNI